MGKSYDDLKNMFDKGRYEMAQGLRATQEAGYLAPEYQSHSMDEKQTSYLEQVQDGMEISQPQPERQQEVQP